MVAANGGDVAPTAPFELVDGVEIWRIFLAPHNPRFEPVETEDQAIDRLCSREDVVPLARDIARYGISPLERFALTELSGTGSAPSYYVEEGNRRICALKLLIDPDRAPAKLRSTFEEISATWIAPFDKVDAAVFSNMDELRTWLDRTHSGPHGGVGRRNWNSEQKQRFFGGTKNQLAQQVLDYAEAEGMITKEERQGKLTTAQRFLNPTIFQEMIGIDRSHESELQRTRPKADFDAMLRKFMRDLVAGVEVSSRMNRPEITAYARALTALPQVTNARIDPEPLSAGTRSAGKRRTTRRRPRMPEKARVIRYETEIADALRELENDKLSSLYHSICTIELALHAPLVGIGVWAFLETLTACEGRSEGTSIDAFLSKERLRNLGFNDARAITAAVIRIRDMGNTTKHHQTAANFNGDQLNNDMATLKAVIIACIGNAMSKK